MTGISTKHKLGGTRHRVGNGTAPMFCFMEHNDILQLKEHEDT